MVGCGLGVAMIVTLLAMRSWTLLSAPVAEIISPTEIPSVYGAEVYTHCAAPLEVRISNPPELL